MSLFKAFFIDHRFFKILVSPIKNSLKRQYGSITVAAMEDQNLLNIETVYAVRGVCTYQFLAKYENF